MTTATTETYSAVAGQAKEATEKSLQVWKDGVHTVADRMTSTTMFPKFDMTEPVERYFEYVQRAVDLNRDLATRWAELVTSMSGSLREQAEQVGTVVKDRTEAVADSVTDLATKQAQKAEDIARQQAEEVEKAEKEAIRQAKAAERAAAKQAYAQAREPYEGLTKAELSDLLAERELPKSGTVEELIERLVSADSD